MCQLIEFLKYRLVIESAALKEHGTYTITASNNIGETIATAKLEVHGKIKKILNARIKLID